MARMAKLIKMRDSIVDNAFKYYNPLNISTLKRINRCIETLNSREFKTAFGIVSVESLEPYLDSIRKNMNRAGMPHGFDFTTPVIYNFETPPTYNDEKDGEAALDNYTQLQKMNDPAN